jgi:hypothetical protein
MEWQLPGCVLTKRGYGFAFNMMPGSKMFRKKLEIG